MVEIYPRDMVGYEDLGQNGVWSEVPEYGPVWRPRSVEIGWAPYRYGRWASVEPLIAPCDMRVRKESSPSGETLSS